MEEEDNSPSNDEDELGMFKREPWFGGRRRRRTPRRPRPRRPRYRPRTRTVW